MEPWSTIQSIGGTAGETWLAGTSMVSISEYQTDSSASTNTDATVSHSGQNRTSYMTMETYAASAYSREETQDLTRSIGETHDYNPSTATSYDGTSTITVTLNYTLTTVSSSFYYATTRRETADTTAQSHYSSSQGRTLNGSTYTFGTDTTTGSTETYTQHGASTFISSFEQSVDEWSTKTISTGTFTNTAWTTVSGSFTVLTTPAQTNSTSSTWTLTQSITQNTTDTTSTNGSSVTYAGDHTTVNASTVTTSNSSTTGSYTMPVTTDVITLHAYSQKIDTVLLLHAGRNADDFNLGDMAWKFTLSALGETASTIGRFTDLFASTSGGTVTLHDYEKYRTNSVALTEILYSQNSVTSTTSMITGTMPATSTASTSTVVSVFSKNGSPWAEYETCTTTYETGTPPATGTASTTGYSLASSNTSTVEHTFAIGDVSSSLSTYTYGAPVSTFSETIFTHSVQVTGYDSALSWTSTTETAIFASSSSSETRLALWSSTSTVEDIQLRSSTTDQILINSYASYLTGTDTSYFHLGKVSTATTRIYGHFTTTSKSLYDADFNPEASRFTTFSTYTLPNGDNGATSAVSEAISITRHTKARALPQIRTCPDGMESFDTASLDVVRFSALPNGYAGFGGGFSASTLAVCSTVDTGILSGSLFAGQSIPISALPTALAYPSVTIFPVEMSATFSIPGAQAASYVTSLSSIGTASVAVTWTSTTATTMSSGTTSTITRRSATHTLAAASPISGTFFREESIVTNSGASFQLVGGYAVGENNLGKPYTVHARSGFARWTEYAPGESTAAATFQTSNTAGSVSFTVPGSHGLVIAMEPVFTANWTGSGDTPFYFTSNPYPYFE